MGRCQYGRAGNQHPADRRMVGCCLLTTDSSVGPSAVRRFCRVSNTVTDCDPNRRTDGLRFRQYETNEHTKNSASVKTDLLHCFFEWRIPSEKAMAARSGSVRHRTSVVSECRLNDLKILFRSQNSKADACFTKRNFLPQCQIRHLRGSFVTDIRVECGHQH